MFLWGAGRVVGLIEAKLGSGNICTYCWGSPHPARWHRLPLFYSCARTWLDFWTRTLAAIPPGIEAGLRAVQPHISSFHLSPHWTLSIMSTESHPLFSGVEPRAGACKHLPNPGATRRSTTPRWRSAAAAAATATGAVAATVATVASLSQQGARAQGPPSPP